LSSKGEPTRYLVKGRKKTPGDDHGGRVQLPLPRFGGRKRPQGLFGRRRNPFSDWRAHFSGRRHEYSIGEEGEWDSPGTKNGVNLRRREMRSEEEEETEEEDDVEKGVDGARMTEEGERADAEPGEEESGDEGARVSEGERPRNHTASTSESERDVSLPAWLDALGKPAYEDDDVRDMRDRSRERQIDALIRYRKT